MCVCEGEGGREGGSEGGREGGRERGREGGRRVRGMETDRHRHYTDTDSLSDCLCHVCLIVCRV